MDQELRATIRALQRADKSMSELNLHELLDDAGLVELMHHCVIARLKHLGATFYVGSAKKNKGDGRVVASEDPTQEPRVFYTSQARLGAHQLSKVVYGENPLEALPPEVTRRIHGEWNTLQHLVKNSPGIKFGYGAHPQAVFKRMGVFAVPFAASPNSFEFHLATVWKETQASFEEFKNKKLREMGLIPGRNG